jgi:hypothetical protein
MMTNEADEEYDTFDDTTDAAGAISSSSSNNFLLFDAASIAHVNATASAAASPHSAASRGTRSAATTQLATDVGSTVVRSRIPFLKSVTFFEEAASAGEEQENGTTEAEAEENGNTEEEIVDVDNYLDDDDVTVEINNLQHWDIYLQDPPYEERHKKKNILHQKFTQSKIGTVLKLNKTPHFIVQDFEILSFPSTNT